MELCDKIRLLDLIKEHKQNLLLVVRICKVFRRTIGRIWANRADLLEMEKNLLPSDVKRSLKPAFPEIEAEVKRFIQYARLQRLPVTKSQIQAMALKAARDNGNAQFKASNGWVEKFLRRARIQRSCELHGKGGTQIPVGTQERMEEIRSTLAKYDLKNIYNMDESGLFYRMGPSRSYLLASENRSEIRVTELQRHKHRLSLVFCVNADASHSFPISFIGKSKNPICLRGTEFSHLKKNYWSQDNGWMDTKGFIHWIQKWYEAVKKNSSGPWCLVMDNCGGHDVPIELEGVEIVFLPSKTTAIHQLFDLGLIAHSKIRYRTALLAAVLEIMENR